MVVVRSRRGGLMDDVFLRRMEIGEERTVAAWLAAGWSRDGAAAG